MNPTTPELEQVVALAQNLSPLDKVRLVERLIATLESELSNEEKKPKRPVYGLWADVSVSEEDIDEARREMWGNFPRPTL